MICIINLREWNITYKELADWCEETGADIYAIIRYGNIDYLNADYGFEREEDMLAFKLRFAKRLNPVDSGLYYAPYIPSIIK